MKSIVALLSIAWLAAALPLQAQEAPARKMKMAPLNEAKEVRTGKIYWVTPEKNRFTIRLDEGQWVVAPDKTIKVVAFLLAEGGKITIDGSEGKIGGLQKGMRVSVKPSAADPAKAEAVDATQPTAEDKKSSDTEE